MGRGAQTQTTQMTDQQLANQNAMNRALHNQGQSLSNTSAGGYQSLLATRRHSNPPSRINPWAPWPALSAHWPRARPIVWRAPAIPPATAICSTNWRASRAGRPLRSRNNPRPAPQYAHQSGERSRLRHFVRAIARPRPGQPALTRDAVTLGGFMPYTRRIPLLGLQKRRDSSSQKSALRMTQQLLYFRSSLGFDWKRHCRERQPCRHRMMLWP